MPFKPEHLIESLCRETAPSCWVAYSGGVDSHGLLHALAGRRHELPFPLGAVHVNHGLQAQADGWSGHCRQVCEDLDVPFVLLAGNAAPAPGESPEASARALRYRLMGEWLPEGALLLSAHHQDDQAETLLLQLLRGAGPRGLSAMPVRAPLGKGWLLRPLLDCTRDDLLAYAEERGLAWVEDPSNRDTRFDRNFLRHRLLPELKTRWPAAAAVLTRSAGLCAEAAQLQEAVAEEDAGVAAGPYPGTLSVAALERLAPPRQRNLLRYWLRQRGFSLPSRAVLQRLLDEVLHCRADAEPRVHWSGAEVRRYRDAVFAMPPLEEWEGDAGPDWDPAGRADLPLADGVLSARPVAGRGLRLEKGEVLRIRFRQGGERIRQPGHAHHHSLKQLLQDQGIPPWERERLPLLYRGDELVAVAGLWFAAGHGAGSGEAGLDIRWSRWPPGE